MAQGKGQQTDSGTHRIYTSNKAPGLGRASSPISVMMGLKRHRFLQGSGTLSGTNSYPALSERRALSLLLNTLQPGVRGLALADARAGHPLLDPPAPRHAHPAPSEPAGASAGVRDSPRTLGHPLGLRRDSPLSATRSGFHGRPHPRPFRPAHAGRDRRRHQPHLSGAVRLHSGSSAAARAPPHPPRRK